MKIQGMSWTKVVRQSVILGMALSVMLSLGCVQAFGQTAAQKAEQERERAAEQQRERAAEQQRERAAEQQRERAAEQQRERAADQQRERAAEQQRERAAEQQRERQPEPRVVTPEPSRPVQPAYVPNNTPAPARTTPNNTYQPRPATTPNNSSTPAQPRAYTPAPAQPTRPATVYTPHAAGSSASSSGSGATTSKPSTSGPTVYTPHAASSAGAASTSTPSGGGAPAHVNGATVYTPHAAASSNTGSAASTAPVHSSPAKSTSSAGSTVSTPAPIHAAYTMPPASSIASKTSNHSVLTTTGSQRVVSQVNTARASLAGVNKRALPTGQVTVQSSGRLALTASGGRQYGLRPNGTLTSFKSAQGATAKFAPNGRFRSVQTAGMKIQYGPHGGRTVVKQLPNHATLVSFGRHTGYVQRPVAHAGASLVQRTYVAPRAGFFVKNTTYVQTFRPYTYRGVGLVSYAPAVYYAPEFYGWAYYPWATPAAYAWGWTGDPWVNAYNGYFTPLSAYSSPAQWMADYILGATLAKAYQEQQDFEPKADADAAADDVAADELAPAGDDAAEGEVYAQTATPITPEIRAAVAEEVRQELASENAIASDQATPEVDQLQEILQPKHFFVVSTLLNVSSDQGNCALTGGDIIGVVKATGSEADTATLTVASGKKGDCPAGAQVEVAVQDLQEMDNNLRAQMDNAVAKLHSEQGQGGLPAAPKSAIAPPPRPAMDDVPSAPETGVSAMLGQEQDQAAQAEAGVVQAAFASNAGGI